MNETHCASHFLCYNEVVYEMGIKEWKKEGEIRVGKQKENDMSFWLYVLLWCQLYFLQCIGCKKTDMSKKALIG